MYGFVLEIAEEIPQGAIANRGIVTESSTLSVSDRVTPKALNEL